MSRLLPQQILLLGLNEELIPGGRPWISREEAYQKLKEKYGKDFGYDVQAWKQWIRRHFTLGDDPRPSLLKQLFLNLDQQIAPTSPEYVSREEAHETLRYVTGQDFGYDTNAWKSWLKEKKKAERAESKLFHNFLNLLWDADPRVGNADEQTQKQAYAKLKELTGQDFGSDRHKWLEWFVREASVEVRQRFASVRRS